MTELERKDMESVVEVLQKYNPKTFSKETLRVLIEKGFMNFETGARSIEAFDQENAIDPEKISGDDKVKNLINPKDVKFDIIVNLTKNHDAVLYNTYKKKLDELDKIAKEMVDKAGDDFSAQMDHIDTIIAGADENTSDDVEFLKKVRNTNLKFI